MNPSQLAIVIPAYRGQFLRSALRSIIAQTDPRFHLYIGDDASPENLGQIVAEECGERDFTFHRFAENLGGAQLTQQWDRCIALTRDEPWIWLFSDDDVAAPNTVAAFYAELTNDLAGCGLLRINHTVVNGDNVAIELPEPHPKRETAGELAHVILRRNGRRFRAPDHIFSRALYNENGFVSLPKALLSDHATWIRFAQQGNGVITLDCPPMAWRRHSMGVSSGLIQRHRSELLLAVHAFIHFLDELDAPTQRQRLTVPRRLIWRYYTRALFWWLTPPLTWRDLPNLYRQLIAIRPGIMVLPFLASAVASCLRTEVRHLRLWSTR